MNAPPQNKSERAPRSRRPRGLLVAMAACVGIAIAVAVWRDFNAPRYGGKRLNAWFAEELEKGPGIISAGPNGIIVQIQERDSLAAFKHNPKVSVPYLVEALEAKDSFLQTKYMALHARLPESLQRKLPKAYPAARVRATAAQVLTALGPDAQAAMPALLQQLLLPDHTERANALIALAAIGPDAHEAVPALKLLLQHEDRYTRELAAVALHRIDSQASSGTAAPEK